MADMNLTQAADEVRKMLRGFKAIDIVAAALEQTGSVQNAAKEAEKHLAELRQQIEAEKALIDAAKIDVDMAKADARKVKETAKKKADELIEKAQAEAAKIYADADAASSATAINVQEANTLLSEVKQKIETANGDLEAIEKKIAAAKKQVATILG